MQWMLNDGVKSPLVYWTVVAGVVAAAVCARCLVALQPYSGMGQPPEFGDFEAQRHWMELTVNLDVHEWYVNGTHNNLTYWGIDYPPLTAYFSWAWGKLFVFSSFLVSSRFFRVDTHALMLMSGTHETTEPRWWSPRWWRWTRATGSRRCGRRCSCARRRL